MKDTRTLKLAAVLIASGLGLVSAAPASAQEWRVSDWGSAAVTPIERVDPSGPSPVVGHGNCEFDSGDFALVGAHGSWPRGRGEHAWASIDEDTALNLNVLRKTFPMVTLYLLCSDSESNWDGGTYQVTDWFELFPDVSNTSTPDVSCENGAFLLESGCATALWR